MSEFLITFRLHESLLEIWFHLYLRLETKTFFPFPCCLGWHCSWPTSSFKFQTISYNFLSLAYLVQLWFLTATLFQRYSLISSYQVGFVTHVSAVTLSIRFVSYLLYSHLTLESYTKCMKDEAPDVVRGWDWYWDEAIDALSFVFLVNTVVEFATLNMMLLPR